MKTALRLLGLMGLSLLGLQLFFAVRVASMHWVDPASTTFQRSEAMRLYTQGKLSGWQHRPIELADISPLLQRAVITAEDDMFTEHNGVQWDALSKAWKRNSKVLEKNPQSQKIKGGSSITQQLAKNLFLSGERTLVRKGQELFLTWTLETFLSKHRILELYLNHIEWGEGVFGAQAASQHYYARSAYALNGTQASELAVMLPKPRYFDRQRNSPELKRRAGKIAARMNQTRLPSEAE